MKNKNKEKNGQVTISAREYQQLSEAARNTQDYLDKLLRSHAEFENLKKRTLREKEQFLKFANEGLICELVDILDHFELAFASANKMKDFKSLHQGVEMILKQIHKLLEKNGVKAVECLGRPFNPEQQEAIAHIESDKQPENTVVEEVRKGYLIGGKLMRPAIVKVSKKSSK